MSGGELDAWHSASYRRSIPLTAAARTRPTEARLGGERDVHLPVAVIAQDGLLVAVQDVPSNQLDGINNGSRSRSPDKNSSK
jgi:hypothetical protein